MGRVTDRRPVVRIGADGSRRRRPDTLAVEEPLELRVDGSVLTVTMRTPGHDLELAHGLLRSEGLIGSADDVASARYCVGEGEDEEGRRFNTYNVLEVARRDGGTALPVSAQRSLVMHSGCGLCGKTSVDAVLQSLPPRRPVGDGPRLAPTVVLELPERLRAGQQVFARTGGTHAAGLFTFEGECLVVREDVGRHNAVDKVTGRALLDGRALDHDVVLAVSSRASFEIVQKAAMHGVSTIATVSAPSSLAVEAADRLGVTLMGFVRGRSLNAYTHTDRLASSP